MVLQSVCSRGSSKLRRGVNWEKPWEVMRWGREGDGGDGGDGGDRGVLEKPGDGEDGRCYTPTATLQEHAYSGLPEYAMHV